MHAMGAQKVGKDCIMNKLKSKEYSRMLKKRRSEEIKKNTKLLSTESYSVWILHLQGHFASWMLQVEGRIEDIFLENVRIECERSK